MKHFNLIVFLILIKSLSYAQISGFVLDEFQNPIQEVTILNKKSNTHTHSDKNGYFKEPNAKSGDSLQFSFIGFKTITYHITESDLNRNSTFNLSESSVALDQINITESLPYNLQLIDNHIRPVQSSQELLRQVPGLFIAQHAGGGKAEQLFLRGFDLDHGTDIQISVDNLIPVNMVSHAHGQGYADLHFIIPETVKRLDFEKGSYNAAKGNFGNAGYVDFILKDRITKNSLIFETGKFDAHRLAGMFNLLKKGHTNSYLATEYLATDGYFEHAQDFKRYNGLLKFNHKNQSGVEFKITASHFNSHWNASGQIPQRAIDQDLIKRFGAIDPNEGGNTDRSNLLFQLIKPITSNQQLKWSTFYTNYNFELFSNFTYFLNDSINGDQIKQKENRNILGMDAQWFTSWNGIEFISALGHRFDCVKNLELSHTKDRQTLLNRLAQGTVNENNSYSYIKVNYKWRKWEISPQLRVDFFQFSYLDKILLQQSDYYKTELKLSPKFYTIYNAKQGLQIIAKIGRGFHSNDSRLLIQKFNIKMLPSATSMDLGMQTKIGNNILFHGGLWFLQLEDELVYVGDEAIVENSGKTKRRGIEAGFRFQASRFLYLDAESSYSNARSADAPENQNFIPLAAKWTHMGGITLKDFKQFSAGLRYRILTDRPANEDNSIIANGYQQFDATVNYQFKNVNIAFIAENIFNQKWNEAQFSTLSRLKDEPNAVEELHFTPGSPINFRIKLHIEF